MSIDTSLSMRTNSRAIKIGDCTYKLDFDMQALSQAEQVYATRFGRDVNVATIVEDLFQVKMSAVMAFAYGALLSAGEKVSWNVFSKEIFTYEHFDEVFNEVSAAIKSLFAVNNEETTEPATGDSKN